MNLKAFWQSSRSTIISAIIAIVVIAGLFVIFNALPAGQPAKPAEEQKQEEQKTDEQKTEEKKNDTDKKTKVTLPTKYTVVRGDNLWKISTSFYGTGYNWVIVAKENKLANPNIVHAGNTLTIPKAEVKASTHTVVRGDSLWGIAERYYGSGYEWYKIRDANNDKVGTLANGRPLITPGQILTIP
jgi:nucleoid-associated protein YgaU